MCQEYESEDEFQGKLEVSSLARTSEGAKPGGVKRGVREAELRGVKQIEGLRTELELEAFAESEISKQGKVQVVERWTLKNIAA